MTVTHLQRRCFLKTLGQASLAALAMDRVPLVRSAEQAAPKASADCMVLLWMAGGMAHTETFDPKRYVPFEPGIESRRSSERSSCPLSPSCVRAT